MSLSVENIKVSYGDTSIIDNISMQVDDNQFVGIIGPNGCGKSTLLKSIYRVIKPDAGSIQLFDMNVLDSSLSNVARKLAVVGQFNEMSFDFTVEEMVLMGRSPHKKFVESTSHKDKELVDKALRAVGLSACAKRSYLTLSGGEKQRVVLARAIAQEPKFLILDEPTNHLDVKYQMQILTIIKSLNIGVLAALHDLPMACANCDVLYVMKHGEVVAHGKPNDIITKQLIKDVFEVECELYTNPITGDLAITYLSSPVDEACLI